MVNRLNTLDPSSGAVFGSAAPVFEMSFAVDTRVVVLLSLGMIIVSFLSGVAGLLLLLPLYRYSPFRGVLLLISVSSSILSLLRDLGAVVDFSISSSPSGV